MSYLTRSNGLLGLVSLNAMTPVAEGPFQRNAMYFSEENYRLFGDKRARLSRELVGRSEGPRSSGLEFPYL